MSSSSSASNTPSTGSQAVKQIASALETLLAEKKEGISHRNKQYASQRYNKDDCESTKGLRKDLRHREEESL